MEILELLGSIGELFTAVDGPGNKRTALRIIVLGCLAILFAGLVLLWL